MNDRVVAEPDMDSRTDRRIRAMLCACFPDARHLFADTRAWHGSGPAWTVLLEDERESLIAHIGIVDRRIRVGGQSLRVGGLQNVCVVLAHRGQGLADRGLAVAAGVMRDSGLDAGLLFCLEPLVSTYERCGWRVLDDAIVTRVDEGGEKKPLPDGSISMWLPLRIAHWPSGSIHLCGNDW